jgi:hypothetical protein
MRNHRRAAYHDHPGNPANQDCPTSVCRRKENTDLTRWRGAMYVFPRTAGSHCWAQRLRAASRLAERRREL